MMCDPAVEAQGGVLPLLMALPSHPQGLPAGCCCVCGVTTLPRAQLYANECKYKTHPTDIMLVLVALLGVSSNIFLSCLSQRLEISKAPKISRVSFCRCARESY